MDADTLRLILLVVGAILILALYLWERGHELDDPGLDDDDADSPPTRTATRSKREPPLGDVDAGDEPREPHRLDPEDPPERFAEALDTAQQEATEPPAPLLLQVGVVTADKQRWFSGEVLMDVAETCGLHPGEMEIFHYTDTLAGEPREAFSMANMITPGTFPFDEMASFATPGLLLFTQLEGEPEDMAVFDEMIATARKLATMLDGEVHDDQRQPLTIKKEEQMRRAVRENERLWAGVTLS
ncbi:cell division protein ZipA C-terminal FtsZ-binding domain-containing protein [Marichromatium bheemlicum]|uniref:Cell division protein ZipA n=1 Tax=Marichromatium bheemlicum TaxID=365339 RepID=A0ABX1IA07_9GAMM|nr:cell division protein ZipA C-terminal FtsZ-binding domain-containing protein [Marichromatium bheemlicum]NKN33671.1 cell division protein ZipA [Marichromatium bheemlicum]